MTNIEAQIDLGKRLERWKKTRFDIIRNMLIFHGTNDESKGQSVTYFKEKGQSFKRY